MAKRLRLIGFMLMVVLAGFGVGTLIDALRLPGVDLALTQTLRAVLDDRAAPRLGPPRPAVTVVIFTDYRCAVCRRDHDDMMAVIASSPQVRFMFKEWAILSPQSRTAARVALAAAYQGRYLPVRDALMRGQVERGAIVRSAVAAGADPALLACDLRRHAAAIDAELARTGRQAFGLGLPGTPAYLVGRRLVIGGLRKAKLRRLIARAASGG